ALRSLRLELRLAAQSGARRAPSNNRPRPRPQALQRERPTRHLPPSRRPLLPESPPIVERRQPAPPSRYGQGRASERGLRIQSRAGAGESRLPPTPSRRVPLARRLAALASRPAALPTRHALAGAKVG